MIAVGVNAKALSTYMGHASISITLDRYGHLFPGSEDEAAGLLDASNAAKHTRKTQGKIRAPEKHRFGGLLAPSSGSRSHNRRFLRQHVVQLSGPAE